MNDTFGRGFRIFSIMVMGALAMIGLPTLLEALASPEVPAMWWASRSFGLLAYVALWFSTLFGVLLAGGALTKGVLDKAIVLELHSWWSVAALVATALHVLFVVGDAHSGVTVLALVVPWASARLTGAVGIGTLGAWALIAIAATTALHQRIPRWAWRAVHASAFGAFVLALVHGVAAGSDTQSLVVRGVYGGTCAVLLGAILLKLAAAATPRVAPP